MAMAEITLEGLSTALENAVKPVRDDVKSLRSDVKSDIKSLTSDVKSDIKSLTSDVNDLNVKVEKHIAVDVAATEIAKEAKEKSRFNTTIIVAIITAVISGGLGAIITYLLTGGTN
ncbi:MAG: hypothetical protein N0C84_01085 [Candidatus Thiodiazotropha taylori]|uniref:Uncharacterized protein n=1 Tax=Candidatus Thiodiazotropha taylori TaxID=2792791 RepID=A0A9E4N369_9GAMM|nr:hypothetical protein [Candidatus Thiodiazotropha taylori]MCW4255040.1 hypothetical protein [Candidatus Thiodiazotropha taylori]